uniref:Putative Transcriptional regulator, TetR family n=1 Tax=Magnetococcus massalia (strain MO-1) TaxID=451514 RepID=A0A1S7LMS3_MAGMO|nr:putative Transcriptional regulator, TetR family [Candidatus Magnetococcus massalia]
MNDQRDPGKTRQRLLMAAYEEIHLKGFQAASLSAILQKAELTKGAMYHHFPNKKALGLAVVDEVFPAVFQEAFFAHFASRNNFVDGFLYALEEDMKKNGEMLVAQGCPVANLAQEMSPIDEDFRVSVNAMFQKFIGNLKRELIKGQQAGNVREDVDAGTTALFIGASMEGCVNLSKASSSIAMFRQCGDGLKQYVKTLRA